jgi:hypothetical protein
MWDPLQQLWWENTLKDFEQNLNTNGLLRYNDYKRSIITVVAWKIINKVSRSSIAQIMNFVVLVRV